jgi:hypothetical protein
MKLVWVIKLCLNKTYSKVHISKHLSDALTIHNDLKEGDALLPLLFNFALEHSIKKVRKAGRYGIEWNRSASGLCQ